MRHRTAVTLIECLMAILIMAIGLIALLTLFPLGAISMRQAIKDDRAAAASGNATSLAVALNLHTDANVSAALANTAGLTDPNGPGFPVYVDGYGYGATAGGTQVGSTSMPRVTLANLTSAGQKDRWFALTDDLVFAPADDANGDKAGTPITAGGNVEREVRYTWAYLLRRPCASNASVVQMTVVVYSGRDLQTAGAEPTYTVSAQSGDTIINLSWANGQAAPAIQKGGWILDATSSANAADQRTYGPLHSDFYRVTSVTISGNTAQLELQTPVKAQTLTTIVVLPNVVEVFDKGTNWKP